MGIEIDENIEVAPYEDVNVDDWFAGYLAYAKEIEIINPDVNIIYPSKPMTRGQVANIIYKVMDL